MSSGSEGISLFNTRIRTKAFITVSHLAMQSTGELRTFDHIAKEYGAPRRNLAKNSTVLTLAGVIRSAKGRWGGFSSDIPTDTITRPYIVRFYDRQRRARSPHKLYARNRRAVCYEMRLIEESLREVRKILGYNLNVDMVMQILELDRRGGADQLHYIIDEDNHNKE